MSIVVLVHPVPAFSNPPKLKHHPASAISAAENGYPQFNVPVLAAIFGPRDMPEETAKFLTHALQAILNEPDVAKAIGETGVEVEPGDAEKLAETVRADLKLVSDTVKQSRAK